MLTSKANTFCLYKVLYDYSDADNILTRADIDEKLMNDYGITMNRHTLSSCITVLENMGFELSIYEDNGKGYYLISREFEPAEVRLLIDSVFFNSAIPQKQTDKLVKKLQGLLPEHKRKRYKNLTVATSVKKTVNKELFFNIDILDEAISDSKKIEFDYYHHNFKKELVKKRDDKYSVCPYALIAAREHYYLIGKFDGADNFTHFRVDKIKGIKITDEKFKKEAFDVSRYADINTMMHGGDYIEAKLRCKNWMLDYLIDEFGQDAKIYENDDGETFTATVKGTFEGLRIWTMHYLDCAEVVEPQVLRDAVVENIKSNMYGEWEKMGEKTAIKNTAIEFLMFSYFGFDFKDIENKKEEVLNKIIQKAYSDAVGQGAFNALIPAKKNWKEKDKYEKLKVKITKSKKFGENIILKFLQCEKLSNDKFNQCHKNVCNTITKAFEEIKIQKDVLIKEFTENSRNNNFLYDISIFSYGNSQKWLNMTLKYLWLLGLLPNGIDEKNLHVPVDSYIIEAAKAKNSGNWALGISDISVDSWSKLNNQEEYEHLQTEIKKQINGKFSSAIQWEAVAWIEIAKKRSNQ